MSFVRRQRFGRVNLTTIVVIGVGVWMSIDTGTVAAVRYTAERDQAKRRDVCQALASIERGLDAYQSRTGMFPDVRAGLDALVDAGILERLPSDPWGHPYLYTVQAGRPVLVSYGKGGTPGGEGSDADVFGPSAECGGAR